MSTIKKILIPLCSLIALVAISVSPLVGCKKSTLALGGAYAPAVTNVVDGTNVVTAASASNPEEYAADSAFKFAYTTIQAGFAIERENRALLFKIDPDIKHTLDTLRPQVVQFVKEYGDARSAYEKQPTPAGLDLMNQIIGKAQQIGAAISTAVTPATAVTAPLSK